MIVLPWSVLLLLILQFVNVRVLSFTSCLPFKTCEVPAIIETKEEKNQEFNPLYLIGKSGTYELVIPRAISDAEKSSDIVVSIPNKKKVIYACPKEHKKVSSALMQQDDIMLSTDTDIRINQNCDQKVEPMMKNLKTICHKPSDNDEFTLYEIGFKVFLKHRSIIDMVYKFITSKDAMRHTWQPLYQLCHNSKTRTTLYTIHTLYGESVAIKKTPFHGSFKDINRIQPLKKNAPEEEVDTKTVGMDNIFQKASVRNLFGKIFEKSKESRYVNEDNDFLARGHLVPDADMIFIPWKHATYVYANVVPMWQYLNNGVWKSVETQIRKAAGKDKKTYNIYTGVSGILAYNRKQIFLGGVGTKIMPIPLYLWKVVHYKNGNENKAIAFVVNNDPYIKRKFLCLHEQDGNDVCSTYGWPKFVSVAEGEKRKTMYCCTLDELRKEVPYAPDLGNVEPLLNPDY